MHPFAWVLFLDQDLSGYSGNPLYYPVMICSRLSGYVEKMNIITKRHCDTLDLLVFCQNIFPLPIFEDSLLRSFHALTAISSDLLLSSGVRRFLTPDLWSEKIILPLISQMVTSRICWSRFMIS